MKRAQATLKPSASREVSLLPALLSAIPLPLCVSIIRKEHGFHAWSQQSAPAFLHEQPAQPLARREEALGRDNSLLSVS